MKRRDFLKSATLATLLGSSPSWNSLLALEQQGDTVLGRCLRKVWRETTIHRTIVTQNLGLSYGAGEDLVVRNDLLKNSVTLSQNPKTLLFFGQITDIHIIDEESPSRLAAVDWLYPTFFHPQEDLLFHSTDAILRTLNKISQQSSLDFLVNTGDTIDNAQEIELRSFIQTINGQFLDPDTGTDQDPVPGANNDGNDPFHPQGLLSNLPVYAALGNHDILHHGFVPCRDGWNAIAEKYLSFMKIHDPLGDYCNGVVLPSATPPDPNQLKPGYVTPDARRVPFGETGDWNATGKNFINTFINNNDVRPILGFPKNLSNKEYGYYSVIPKQDVPIKLIVLDTTSRYGGAHGTLDKQQFEEFLIPELEAAKKEQQLVIIASHHPSETILTPQEVKQHTIAHFTKNARFEQYQDMDKFAQELVTKIDDGREYISRNQFVETLLNYPNVFLHIVGHDHYHKVIPHGGETGYWEIKNASLVEFPQQARLFEVVYEGAGIAAIHTTVVDHDSTKGSLASQSRERAHEDQHRNKNRGRGETQDRNTILRFQVPAEIAKKLESF